MIQDRFKTVFWLFLFKSLQPCLGGGRKWSTENWHACHYTRRGKISLADHELSWGLNKPWGSRRKAHNKYNDSSPPQTINPDDCHGLNLPSLFQADHLRTTRHVALRRRKGPRAAARKKDTDVEPKSSFDETIPDTDYSAQLSVPLIPTDAWEAMTGIEFEDESLVDALAKSGLEMCTQDENSYIEWRQHKDTEKILQEMDRMEALQEGNVLVDVGKAKKEAFGSQLPIIRTQSILPMSAKDMADLLMDSDRVKIYNKMSLGRKDIRIYNERTKIVQNLTQPPVSKSKMISVTLMHARALDEDDKTMLNSPYTDGYLVVSRAVPGMVEEEFSECPRNDILLGANLLQDIGPNECIMTAVTHVYSPALPTMLARSMGVSSAISFVRDVRGVCEPVNP